jgi:hypothetical protein
MPFHDIFIIDALLNDCQQRSPVTVVVISNNEEGDRSVESLEVEASVGWVFQSDPYRGREQPDRP